MADCEEERPRANPPGLAAFIREVPLALATIGGLANNSEPEAKAPSHSLRENLAGFELLPPEPLPSETSDAIPRCAWSREFGLDLDKLSDGFLLSRIAQIEDGLAIGRRRSAMGEAASERGFASLADARGAAAGLLRFSSSLSESSSSSLSSSLDVSLEMSMKPYFAPVSFATLGPSFALGLVFAAWGLTFSDVSGVFGPGLVLALRCFAVLGNGISWLSLLALLEVVFWPSLGLKDVSRVLADLLSPLPETFVLSPGVEWYGVRSLELLSGCSGDGARAAAAAAAAIASSWLLLPNGPLVGIFSSDEARDVGGVSYPFADDGEACASCRS